MSRYLITAAAALAVLCVAPRLHAQEQPRIPAGPDEEEARSLFEAGRIAYESGNFERAIERFQEAYELSGLPALHYNIAQAADRLRRDEQALEAYERFLAEAPDDVTRRRGVEARIEVLRRAIAERRAGEEAAAADAAEPDDAPPPEPPSSALPWVVLASSAAVAVTGGVLVGLGASDRNTVEDAPDGVRWDDIRDAADRSQTLSVTGLVLLGVGAAGLATSFVLLAADDGGEAERLEARLGAGSVSLVGRFE